MAVDYHSQFLKQNADVLVERVKEGIGTGYTQHYIPAEFPCPEDRQNSVVAVKVAEATGTGISGMISL